LRPFATVSVVSRPSVSFGIGPSYFP
jgi:hypothetical protein